MRKIIYSLFTLLCINLYGCKDDHQNIVLEKPTIFSSSDTVYFLGSSTIEYFGETLTTWPVKFQLNPINLGKAGEMIDSMCIRIGALPAHATFIEKNLKFNEKNYFEADWGYDYALKAFKGKIANIEGTIGIDSKGYYFESTQNAKVNSNQSYLIESLEVFVKNSVFIVNLGKNNLLNNSHGEETYQHVLAKSTQCIEWIDKNITSRVIVMGHFTSVNPNDSLRNNTSLLNQKLATYYPDNFFNFNQYLVNQEIWNNLGITPNNSDLEAQIKGDLAVSLSSDQIHLNNKTNQFITDLLYNIMQKKKWVD